MVAALINQYLLAEHQSIATEWLQKFASGNGQMNIATILIYGEKNDRFNEVIRELEKAWELDFQYNHPEARANDTIGKTGLILKTIIKDAGLIEIEILADKIAELMTAGYKISTANSVYNLSAKPEEGFRKIVRESDGDVYFGELITINFGQSLSFKIADGESAGKYWNTSPVMDIVPI